MGQQNGQKSRPVSLSANISNATPEKQMPAYAGPTFHASPAPSSLPVPKFFSRSVPNVAPPASLQARMEGEKTPEKESSSPESDTVSPVPARASQQSPLDVFFQADKAEREKRRSTGGLLSPQSAAVPLHVPATEPSIRHHSNPFQHSGKGIFLQELDGDNDADMPSPRTVPNTDRSMPRAKSSPGNVPQVDTSANDREATTQSLKNLLFSVQAQPPAAAASNGYNHRPQSTPRIHDSSLSQPSPFQRSASGPSTPQPPAEEQSHYSLHYGNRNLSPLFKAARNETPSRPSSLRRELANGSTSSEPDHASGPGYHSGQQQDSSQQAAAAARNYLDQQTRASQPSQFPFGDTNSVASFSGPSHRGVQESQSSSSGSPRNGGSRDVKTMENDLRRMLKIL